jgi:phosphatidylglycerophosphate synthase
MTEAATIGEQDDEVPWKLRVEEPTNRFVYYPMARQLVKLLLKTPISANQVTIMQPFIAALAGILIAQQEHHFMIAGAVIFELRSFLDCVDGTLARAKKTCSPNGHALDALCDWIGVVCLYLGILFHFVRFPPPAGPWQAFLPASLYWVVVWTAGVQGGFRSSAHDYFMRKYASIIETARDATVEDLRELEQKRRRTGGFLLAFEAWSGRVQHLNFNLEFFDADQTKSLSREQAEWLASQRNGPLMRFIAKLWSVSNGDAFIRVTIVGVLFGHDALWTLMLVWATFGVVSMFAVIQLNAWFMRRAHERQPGQAI